MRMMHRAPFPRLDTTQRGNSTASPSLPSFAIDFHSRFASLVVRARSHPPSREGASALRRGIRMTRWSPTVNSITFSHYRDALPDLRETSSQISRTAHQQESYNCIFFFQQMFRSVRTAFAWLVRRKDHIFMKITNLRLIKNLE